MRMITKKKIRELMKEHQQRDVVGYEITFVGEGKKIRTTTLKMMGFNEDYWFVRNGTPYASHYSWENIIDLKLIHDDEMSKLLSKLRLTEVKAGE